MRRRVPAPWVPPLKDNMDRSHFALQAEPSAEPDDPATIALVDRTNWEVWDYFNAHDGDDGGGGGGLQPRLSLLQHGLVHLARAGERDERDEFDDGGHLVPREVRSAVGL